MNEDPLRLARELQGRGDLRAAAGAYDRAYGIDPLDAVVAAERSDVLDRLAVEEHGIRFRYIPAGTFLMGCDSGDPDEAPAHPVTLGDFWLAETTISWTAFCGLSGWSPPPSGMASDSEQEGRFFLYEQNKIRLQYCEDQTVTAHDWHAHLPDDRMRPHFPAPPRADPQRPWSYDTKPMVSIAWQDAETLCRQLSTSDVRYSLPTEAQWEKAARGGLVGRRYPWGDEPPTPQRCDFDRFHEFSVRPARDLPPNGYGLYAMAGSVWEWTSDWYDSGFYADSPAHDPTGPADGQQRVLRGGSWSDCADALTVSFRMSRGSQSWTEGSWSPDFNANVGFRICRRI